MRSFVKQFKAEHTDLTYITNSTLNGLYQFESIDEACLAGFMLGEHPKFRAQLPLSSLDQLFDLDKVVRRHPGLVHGGEGHKDDALMDGLVMLQAGLRGAFVMIFCVKN